MPFADTAQLEHADTPHIDNVPLDADVAVDADDNAVGNDMEVAGAGAEVGNDVGAGLEVADGVGGEDGQWEPWDGQILEGGWDADVGGDDPNEDNGEDAMWDLRDLVAMEEQALQEGRAAVASEFVVSLGERVYTHEIMRAI